MKKLISVLLAILLIPLFFDLSAYGFSDVSAQAAVLFCVNSGEVLYSKNQHNKLSMASTTKIMTSLLALEHPFPDMEITVTEEMVSVEGTSMGLLAGDSVSLRELVYGMMIQSGNDAANAVACVLSGDTESFSKLMNQRAKEIGMTNTNFVTPSGLDDENHYSTAYDMALLAAECIRNPEFAHICSQKRVSLTYGNPPYPRTLKNHNRLLWLYEDSIGIKTGFTKKSGRCLVSAAERDGIILVAVTLKAPDDWNDHIAMFEYGFSEYKGVELTCDTGNVTLAVAGGNKNSVNVRLADSVSWISGKKSDVRILLPRFVYAPVNEGEIVGKAVFISEGKVIGESRVMASETVLFKNMPEESRKSKRDWFLLFSEKLKSFFRLSEVN